MTNTAVSKTSKIISITVFVLIFVVAIVYAIVMFECYKNKSFIFAKYNIPEPPKPYFRPLGVVTPMTQEEINERNRIIRQSVGLSATD